MTSASSVIVFFPQDKVSRVLRRHPADFLRFRLPNRRLLSHPFHVGSARTSQLPILPNLPPTCCVSTPGRRIEARDPVPWPANFWCRPCCGGESPDFWQRSWWFMVIHCYLGPGRLHAQVPPPQVHSRPAILCGSFLPAATQFRHRANRCWWTVPV